jgi:hypothetical protein
MAYINPPKINITQKRQKQISFYNLEQRKACMNVFQWIKNKGEIKESQDSQ